MHIRKSKEKHRINGAILLLICACIAILGVLSLFSSQRKEAAQISKVLELDAELSQAESSIPLSEYEETPDIPVKEYRIAAGLSINSANAILVRVEDGSVLLEKNSTVKIFPASMSKIMTAIVALEHLIDLDETILLGRDVFSCLIGVNASVAGFVAGEEVRAIDLLYGLMLPSGAECGMALAFRVSGSESAFVKLMNSKAQELGMNDTHYTNTSGLHDAGHFSTVNDMAALLLYAIENDTFYEIFTSRTHLTPPTAKHKEGLAFSSTLFSNIVDSGFEGGTILGGKTGYTQDAGRCLASIAEKDGELFILVTSGATGVQWAQEPAESPQAQAQAQTQTQAQAQARGETPGALPDIARSQNLHIEDAFAIYAAIEVR